MKLRDLLEELLMETGGTAAQARESFVVTIIVIIFVATIVLVSAASDSARARRRAFPDVCASQCREAGLRMTYVEIEQMRCHCGPP